MGNKRKREEEKITKKIEKLERKLKRRRRVISSEEEDSGNEVQVLCSPIPVPSPTGSPRAPLTNCEVVNLDMPSLISPIPRTLSAVVTSEEGTVQGPGMEPEPTTLPEIDLVDTSIQEEMELEEDILQILGEAPQRELALGKNIHKDLASRWQDILLRGLSKEIKEPIMQKYPIPANCNLLLAPILNPEARTAVPDYLSKRDTTIMQKQNQIGVALAALSQVSELILHNDTSKQKLLQPLSDACRILCDSHYIESQTRRSILMRSINTNLRDTLTSTNRDKYLFGENLDEKLKVAKSVQKTGETLVIANRITSSNKNTIPKNNPVRNLNFRGTIPRKPPNKPSESPAQRGRPPTRQLRAPAYTRHPPPPLPPQKVYSPTRRQYRR